MSTDNKKKRNGYISVFIGALAGGIITLLLQLM